VSSSARAIIKAYGRSDVGRSRAFNEDRFSLSDVSMGANHTGIDKFDGAVGDDGFLLLVSDGAGGDGRGEIASALAVHIFQNEIFNGNKKGGVGERLICATQMANEIIWERSRRAPEMAGMAATLTAVWVIPPLAYVLEVGDSRCYLVRSQSIRQITRDQPMVQSLIDEGIITPFSANKSQDRNIALQSLGTKQTITPAITSLELAWGDFLLVCSDGLTKHLTEEEMLDIIAGSQEIGSACRLLIESAREKRADDNITAILAEVEGEAFSLPETLSALVRSQSEEETDLSDDLEDLTDILSPAETKNND
jgi:PPM family protein phosphatase